MAFVVNGDQIQMKVGTYAINQAGYNIFHLAISNAVGNSVTVAEIAAHYDNIWAPIYKTLMNVSAEYVGCSTKKLGINPTAEFPSMNFSGFGLVLGDLMSTQTTGMITKRTDLQGRANRGRVYVPFPSEDSNGTNGKPDAVYVANLRLLGDAMVATETVTGASGGTVDCIPTIYHKLTGLDTFITGYTERPRWATQRSRGSYGAVNPRPWS